MADKVPRCQDGGRGVRWKGNDGTGAQQEIVGLRVLKYFVGTCWGCRDGTGQGRDSDEGRSQIKFAEV